MSDINKKITRASTQASQGETAFSTEQRTALIVVSLVFLSSWLGIVTRPDNNLAAFWPANALLLGLFVRAPRFASPVGWIAAVLGYVGADLFTGDSAPIKILLLTTANILSVATGYWMYSRYDESIRSLKRSQSILVMVCNVAVASAVAGVLGACIDPLFFNGTPLHGWSFWFVTEFVNYMAILPVIFSAPKFSWRWLERRKQSVMRIDLRHSAPIFAVVLSCILSVLIGGPGAVAFPVPALLWCSVTYSVFTIALLSLVISAWTLIAISTQVIDLAIAGSLADAEMSIRIGVTLVTLAPLTLAVAMVSRNELLSRLLDIASHDQLTGLLNRHAFRERCNTLLTQLVIDSKPASLLIIDIDHFKKVNDTYGHAAGDQALINFSRTASACLRSSDVFGRISGEEFAVLLPDCLRSNVPAIAERIRKTIAETPIDLSNNFQLSITVSIGAAVTHEAPPDIDSLLLVADSALYRAKNNGRNRIVESEFQFGQIAPRPAA